MTLEQVPEPEPGPGAVLLRPLSVGICGSELSGYLGENSLRRPPLVMGHEVCAVVIAGPGGGRWHPGERVVVNPLLTCGTCAACRRGAENLCVHRRLVGAAGPGAFADRLVVPESACHAAPEVVSDDLVAMVEPLACAVRGVEQARVGPGDTVLVMGGGSIGLLTIAVARRAGAGLVAVVEHNPERLLTARSWGATHLLEAGDDAPAEMRSLTGGLGADIAIDAVGLASTRRAALRSVRPGGRAVFIGLHAAESTLPINELVRAETEVRGSFAYTARSFAGATALVREGLLPEGGWLEVRPLEAGADAFRDLVDGAVGASKIVLRV
jgi:threonine dehydrogenase-like Zn-dependent dehydrogenase